jgi:2-dehydropantoate 2-reductase
MTSTRIAVVGTGANGASIAADLTRDGLDVTLIEQWPAHVRAMRSDGVRVEFDSGETETTPVRVHDLCEVAELRTSFDAVLILVKAYDTRWAAELIRPLVAPRGVVAGVQNGMTTAAIADVVGADRTVGTVIEVSSTMRDPGVVRRHTDRSQSWFAVGAPYADLEGRDDVIADLLGRSGRVARVDDILATKWMKLVSNTTTLVTTAITGLPMIDAAKVPGVLDVMLEAGRETVRVGRAQGYPVLPIFGLTPVEVADVDHVAETLHGILYRDFTKPGATTTVLQDWTKGRRSEAADLNGVVVSLGAPLGIPTPVNAAVVDVARLIEEGSLAPGAEATRRMLAVANGAVASRH